VRQSRFHDCADFVVRAGKPARPVQGLKGKSGDAILTYAYQGREVANSVSFPTDNGPDRGDDLAVGVESCAHSTYVSI